MNTIVKATGQMSSDRAARGAQQTASGKVNAGIVLHKILRVLLAVLKWATISILALSTGLLTAISLFWGPTHWTIAIVMAAAWVGLLWLPVFGPARFGRWRGPVRSAVEGKASMKVVPTGSSLVIRAGKPETQPRSPPPARPLKFCLKFF